MFIEKNFKQVINKCNNDCFFSIAPPLTYIAIYQRLTKIIVCVLFMQT